MQDVVIHSDGGCRGNPGPGGWGVVLACGEHRREFSGGALATTNNRMELQAAIEALRALRRPSRVDFFTDSQYVKNGITMWIQGWKRKNWTGTGRKPVKNRDLWQALDAETDRHEVTWQWVKGHSGQAGNEQCDVLANAAMDRIVAEHSPTERAEALKRFQAETESAPKWDGLAGLAPAIGSEAIS